MLNIDDGRQQTTLGGIGRRVVLPSSFTGGPRYMHQLYQDSMAIARKKGKPDLFITFTCNPKWEEINNALLPGQSAHDRPDLTSRVFYQKHKDLMHLLLKKAIFGTVVGYVYVIEFQKRGLPHSHMLLILEGQHKSSNVCDYDKLVCAKLPDNVMFPDLFKIISHSNIHGPCGPLNTKAPCMVEGRCKHRYPRTFSETTIVDDFGYPTYMRRDAGRFVELRENKSDCRWVVPYNPFLSLRYNAYINVEACSTVTAVKYLYKYVFKSHDRATVHMMDGDRAIDEINSYLDARYVLGMYQHLKPVGEFMSMICMKRSQIFKAFKYISLIKMMLCFVMMMIYETSSINKEFVKQLSQNGLRKTNCIVKQILYSILIFLAIGYGIKAKELGQKYKVEIQLVECTIFHLLLESNTSYVSC